MLQCFAAGAGLFAIFTLLDSDREEAITLSDAGLAALLGEFEMLSGKTASEPDRQRVIDGYYERELLYREGMRLEIFRDDAELRALIIERMQQRVTGELPSPSGRDLVNYYADNLDRYYREATISLTQLSLPAEPDDPDALLQALEDGGRLDRAGQAPVQSYPDYGVSLLRGLFGQQLLDVFRDQPLGEWRGPYKTESGWHFFRVNGRRPRELLSYESARDQVAADYQADLVAQRLQTFVDLERENYPLRRVR